MSNRHRAIGLLAILAVVLLLVVTGYLRPLVVVPLYNLAVALRVLLEGIPQRLIWIALLVFAVALVWRTSIRKMVSFQPRRNEPANHAGAVDDWLAAIRSEQHAVNSDGRLAQALRKLTLDVLVEDEPIADKHSRRRLEDARLGIPQDTLLFLQGREQIRAKGRNARREHTDEQLARLVRLLQDTIEKPEGNNP